MTMPVSSTPDGADHVPGDQVLVDVGDPLLPGMVAAADAYVAEIHARAQRIGDAPAPALGDGDPPIYRELSPGGAGPEPWMPEATWDAGRRSTLVEYSRLQMEEAGIDGHDPSFAQALIAVVAVFDALPVLRDGYARGVAADLLARLLRGEPLSDDALLPTDPAAHGWSPDDPTAPPDGVGPDLAVVLERLEAARAMPDYPPPAPAVLMRLCRRLAADVDALVAEVRVRRAAELFDPDSANPDEPVGVPVRPMEVVTLPDADVDGRGIEGTERRGGG